MGRPSAEKKNVADAGADMAENRCRVGRVATNGHSATPGAGCPWQSLKRSESRKRQ
jgi:hypothetical protein